MRNEPNRASILGVCRMSWLLSVLLSLNSSFNSWCERHLISDDPYQFESLTVDELLNECLTHISPALLREIENRLKDTALSRDDREILSKLLARAQSRKPR